MGVVGGVWGEVRASGTGVPPVEALALSPKQPWP